MGNTSNTTTIVTLSSPLPCGMMREGERCGRPAYAAYVAPVAKDPIPDDVVAVMVAEAYQGHWIILPVCEQCVRDLSEHYRVREASDEEA